MYHCDIVLYHEYVEHVELWRFSASHVPYSTSPHGSETKLYPGAARISSEPLPSLCPDTKVKELAIQYVLENGRRRIF